ncbi:helicase associated domain-containing protein, partial [Candidatus Uhrbacteria bacterium]|nr:helicase associated domain-containing protein [Candidatus Uhrbacteria bacterium]
MATRRPKSPVTLLWVPEASPEQRWQLRVLRDFRNKRQLAIASVAWEALSAFTELRECTVPDPKNPETWDVVLVLTHRSVWQYRQHKGTLRKLTNLLRRYLTIPPELATMLKESWGKGVRLKKVDHSWDINFALLVEFRRLHPESWPLLSTTFGGKKIGAWCHTQRHLQISSGYRHKLNSIGFPWDPQGTRWNKMFLSLQDFRDKHSDYWPEYGETYRGENLGFWCRQQRQALRRHFLASDRRRKLNSIGFPWDLRDMQWEEMFALLKQFRREHPDRWPMKREVYRRKKIAAWCERQRRDKKNGQLLSRRRRKLNSIGFPWKQLEERWGAMFALLK